jgi:hypothetical protein
MYLLQSKCVMFLYGDTLSLCIRMHAHTRAYIRGSFEKLVDWRQCAAVMHRKAVTVISSCGGRGNVVVV